MAAFDDVIDDGVNVITISIGSGFVTSFDEDPFTIGAFHAMKKGILTIQPASNEGPQIATVSCVAPWILTVAASTIDRHIIDKVVMANGKTLVECIMYFLSPRNIFILVYLIQIFRYY